MKITLFVTGMHCEHCCGTVESALMAVPGLESCKVEVGVVEFVYDETTTRKSDLLAAVRRAGAFNIERFEAAN
ncbi:MAG: heavy-metal-associated domain-containing protein [Planctomycetes bacterium]|nr:heavy-metal-associated domain-containing protein [Planctomycetota bacterium]